MSTGCVSWPSHAGSPFATTELISSRRESSTWKDSIRQTRKPVAVERLLQGAWFWEGEEVEVKPGWKILRPK